MPKLITMKSLLLLIIIGLILSACEKKATTLYKSNEFTLFSNKVIQGENEANIISSTEIQSNYRSLVHENFSRLVTYKFCINEKDNEKRPLADHWVIIDKGHQSPIIKFGAENAPVPNDPGTKLPVNYEYTFRVDMNPVLSQFEQNGYYQAYDGSKIAKSDFRSICIAGGSEPLSWDFVNLEEKGLDLKDPDGDGIYELTLVFNPFDPSEQTEKTWSLSQDISMKPRYESDQPLVDALFNLSLEEARLNIEADSTLRTGAKWGGVWTRDVSYSILLAFAYHEPEVAKISLIRKVKRDRIIQDTGSGGAWPVSSDRTTWALGAWEIFKVTGDMEWLQTAYTIIKNTLDDDYKTLQSERTGLYRGESSFLDWREQTYPRWMSNKDIYLSENLGTNVVHYQAHIILVEMAKILGEPYVVYQQRADEIKTSINEHLWMDNKGYYAQYLYGRTSFIKSPRFEALGEALAILFGVADAEKAKTIVEESPLTEFGTTCIYPQIPGIPPYHNNGIWPFVQSYWNLAAAKAGNETVLNHGLAAIYRAGGLFLTNYENFVADNGDYVGTEINSHRMLWSMAGNLAMVHRLFIGMNFEIDGIHFKPIIPKTYSGNRKLSDFKYRDALLDIETIGHGNIIATITLDGSPLDTPFIPASISGKHSIKIEMANNNMGGSINIKDNKFSLNTPQANIEGNKLNWQAIEGTKHYNIYKNGKLLKQVQSTFFTFPMDSFAEYTISAIDNNNYESFTCEPLWVYPKTAELAYQIERFSQQSELPFTNFTGTGFIKTSITENKTLYLEINVPKPGMYNLDFRYSNGTGPWNTDNNCAIRSLYINSKYKGVVVMPQRGVDEWSDWGYTNSFIIQLKKGKNKIQLKLEQWNTNMDGSINEALIDKIRLIKVD